MGPTSEVLKSLYGQDIKTAENVKFLKNVGMEPKEGST